jgi:hypothetical protein
MPIFGMETEPRPRSASRSPACTLWAHLRVEEGNLPLLGFGIPDLKFTSRASPGLTPSR